MAGYEILQGNYEPGNFSQGTALWLQPDPGLLNCPFLLTPPDSYTFNPLSEANVVTGSHVSGANVVSGTHVGFWAGGSTYNPFAPGIYTVLAGDEWGNVVILHFKIQG
jgi:hypothetical protein